MKKLKMYFHAFGVTSETMEKVVAESVNFISLQRDEDGNVWKFDKRDGRCVNDNTGIYGTRTIDKLN